ncbi:MAG: hypothetical protein QXT36_01790 [Candidatus Micrarchaeaceae archaeon]
MSESGKTSKKRSATAADQAKTQSTNAEHRASASKEKAIILTIVVVVAIAIVAAYYFVFLNFSTPFPTFLNNLRAAPRISVLVGYSNTTQFAEMSSCYSAIVESIAHTRNATTIDFFVVNATTCYYSPGGLGRPINITTSTAKKCVSEALSEPSVFLNYSSTNRTVITPYHLYVYGNSAYMRSCGIAADLS